MRVLYINHEKNLGGAARSLLGLISEMKKKDVEIFVLTPYKNGKFIDKCKEIGDVKIIYKKYFSCVMKNKKNGIKDIFWYIIIYFLNYIYNYIIALIISRQIHKYKIDIIHTNTSVINLGNYITRFTNLKHIVHIREFVEEDFGWNFVPNRDKVFLNIKQHSNVQIFISKALQNKYLEYFDLNTQLCIYNGVENKNIVNNHKDNVIFTMIIASRLIEGKGQIDAINAMNVLVNEMKIDNIKLYIAGSGDIKYIEYLKQIVNKFDLSNKIEFLGYIDDLQKVRLKTDVELVCSKSEAFGRVVIEGMMAGNIVIASNTGAFPELIENGTDGFIYEFHNYRNLANIIYGCFTNKYDLEKIRENAIVKSNNRFNQELNGNSIMKVYKELLYEN